MYQHITPDRSASRQGVNIDPRPYTPENAGHSGQRALISRNVRMTELIGQLDYLATAQATVLIQGESGTGKEVFARELHCRSSRAKGPLVQINCAALPEGLLESELFGHERGAFTGAVRQRAGRFELAHGGTLFLDEIGAADYRVQLRLLRVLQERAFERVGGAQTLTVDVRVIAATNANLQEEVQNGRFREDLFYRLNVLPLHLPPLRERSEDIALLVDHFIHKAAHRNGRLVESIDVPALQKLVAFPWPGNVRQLENTVERMVVLARERELTLADLPMEIATWRAEEASAEQPDCSFQEARNRFERRFLCAALGRHKGVISQVAEAIGMSRKNLYLKMEHLQIDYEHFRR